jgi:Cu/Ag efflux pump CusA
MALGSTTRVLLIFLNVPFATVGGVGALWARGIPFRFRAALASSPCSEWQF